MLEQQQQHAAYAAPETQSSSTVYRRPLAGGGFVELELDVGTSEAGRSRGRVIVERRADPSRRLGHAPPVVAVLEGDDRDELVTDLFRMAQDNAALGRGLLRWHSDRQRAD